MTKLEVLFPTLLWPLGATFALSLFPGGKYALYPFKLFGTWVHECCHAVTVLLVGGNVKKITLDPDTSGLTYFQIPSGRIRESLVASSGYLGSSAAGCALYFLAMTRSSHTTQICIILGIAMLISILLWVRNPFGILSVLILGLSLILLGLPSQHLAVTSASRFLLPFLALQLALNTLFDLRALFGMNKNSRSDAHTMRSLLWLPAGFWACFWIALSLAMITWTLHQIHPDSGFGTFRLS